jgi:uncharacterized RDD family membrane protein YckC
LASPLQFLASPGKRIAATVYDLFAVFLIFLVLVSLAELFGEDLGSFRVFMLVALAYQLGLPIGLHGQTLGKRAQGICIISATGAAAAPTQAFVRGLVRCLPLLLLTIEYKEWDTTQALAGLSLRIAVLLFVLGEISLIQRPPARQSRADRLARTLVVNQPELLAHRAPAGPMFSANDEEFGHPPSRPGTKH